MEEGRKTEQRKEVEMERRSTWERETKWSSGRRSM